MATASWKKILKLSCIAVVGFGVAFTAFMGFAHTRAGRPVLSWMGRLVNNGAICPLGYDKPLSSSERISRRKAYVDSHLKSPLANRRSMFDIELGKTTKSASLAWVTAQGGSCKSLKSPFDFECSGRFFAAQTGTLWLEFDELGVLVTARGVEKFSDAKLATDLFGQFRENLRHEGRAKLQEEGVFKTSDLKSHLLSQASVSSEYRNFSASARITNMGDSFAVTHEALAF